MRVLYSKAAMHFTPQHTVCIETNFSLRRGRKNRIKHYVTRPCATLGVWLCLPWLVLCAPTHISRTNESSFFRRKEYSGAFGACSSVPSCMTIMLHSVQFLFLSTLLGVDSRAGAVGADNAMETHKAVACALQIDLSVTCLPKEKLVVHAAGREKDSIFQC